MYLSLLPYYLERLGCSCCELSRNSEVLLRSAAVDPELPVFGTLEHCPTPHNWIKHLLQL